MFKYLRLLFLLFLSLSVFSFKNKHRQPPPPTVIDAPRPLIDEQQNKIEYANQKPTNLSIPEQLNNTVKNMTNLSPVSNVSYTNISSPEQQTYTNNNISSFTPISNASNRNITLPEQPYSQMNNITSLAPISNVTNGNISISQPVIEGVDFNRTSIPEIINQGENRTSTGLNPELGGKDNISDSIRLSNEGPLENKTVSEKIISPISVASEPQPIKVGGLVVAPSSTVVNVNKPVISINGVAFAAIQSDKIKIKVIVKTENEKAQEALRQNDLKVNDLMNKLNKFPIVNLGRELKLNKKYLADGNRDNNSSVSSISIVEITANNPNENASLIDYLNSLKYEIKSIEYGLKDETSQSQIVNLILQAMKDAQNKAVASLISTQYRIGDIVNIDVNVDREFKDENNPNADMSGPSKTIKVMVKLTYALESTRDAELTPSINENNTQTTKNLPLNNDEFLPSQPIPVLPVNITASPILFPSF